MFHTIIFIIGIVLAVILIGAGAKWIKDEFF